jgi:hypothetical protein
MTCTHNAMCGPTARKEKGSEGHPRAPIYERLSVQDGLTGEHCVDSTQDLKGSMR